VLDQLTNWGRGARACSAASASLPRRLLGIMARDVLYLKVDDRNRAYYVRAGMGPSAVCGSSIGTMRDYAVPLEVLENAGDLAQWAQAVTLRRRRRAARDNAGHSAHAAPCGLVRAQSRMR
jgi:hypothetical protein